MLYIKVTKTKNGCGGIYRMGTFSLDWRIKTGALLGASADGRLTKTPISKNISADIARDRECITAHIMSALKLNYEDMPNGTVLDIVIHSSAISGEDGMDAFVATLDTFMKGGGLAIQYNFSILMCCAVLRSIRRNIQLCRYVFAAGMCYLSICQSKNRMSLYRSLKHLRDDG